MCSYVTTIVKHHWIYVTACDNNNNHNKNNSNAHEKKNNDSIDGNNNKNEVLDLMEGMLIKHISKFEKQENNGSINLNNKNSLVNLSRVMESLSRLTELGAILSNKNVIKALSQVELSIHANVGTVLTSIETEFTIAKRETMKSINDEKEQG